MLTKLLLASLCITMLPLTSLAAPQLQTTIRNNQSETPQTEISIKNSGSEIAQDISVTFFPSQTSILIANKLQPQQSMQRLIKAKLSNDLLWAYAIRFSDTTNQTHEMWHLIHPWGTVSFNKASLFNPELIIWISCATLILVFLLKRKM